MKRDDLFQSAVVLARSRRDKDMGRKRSRCTVIRTFTSGVSTLTDEAGYLIIADTEDIRPARITKSSLKEIGFVERETICPRRLKPSCHEFVYPLEYPWSRETRIILKDECDEWGPTRMFGGLGAHKVSYVHEVQKILNSKQEQK